MPTTAPPIPTPAFAPVDRPTFDDEDGCCPLTRGASAGLVELPADVLLAEAELESKSVQTWALIEVAPGTTHRRRISRCAFRD
jgi:hypothetical protein